ncbi:MAG: hypothetical protein SGJ27_09540 [Candidatus Melainabacteria bacterium]|nr:hypothetical protein [Candidatus Melainabacteria bacterium]
MTKSDGDNPKSGSSASGDAAASAFDINVPSVEQAEPTVAGQRSVREIEVCEPLAEEQVEELLLQLSDSTPGLHAPTETYTHPVTGREVYVPKSQKEFGAGAVLSTMALLMFVGGGLATLMMVARAFNMHGDILVSFVIGSCALILGMAGGLLLQTMGDKWWLGSIIGACFGAVGGILIYAQTSHHPWWH